MSREWQLVLLVGASTMLLKAAGVLIHGRSPDRRLPPGARRIIERLPPSMFAALIVSQVFISGRTITVDARSVGLAAAVTAIIAGAPTVVTLTAAVGATALVRRFGTH